LFAVRVAGNVAADVEIASIEYAAEHLHTPLIVVLGHQKCGAVTAAVEGGEAGGHLPSIVNLIRPAVEQAKSEPADRLDNAIRDNVFNVVRQLRESKPVLAELVHEGKLKIVGGVYSLDTGKATLLPDNPAKAKASTEPDDPPACPVRLR